MANDDATAFRLTRLEQRQSEIEGAVSTLRDQVGQIAGDVSAVKAAADTNGETIKTIAADVVAMKQMISNARGFVAGSVWVASSVAAALVFAWKSILTWLKAHGAA